MSISTGFNVTAGFLRFPNSSSRLFTLSVVVSATMNTSDDLVEEEATLRLDEVDLVE